MNRANRLVLSFVLVWIIIKLAFFMSGERALGFSTGILANIFFILALIATTLHFKYKSVRLEDTTMLEDVRSAMLPAAKYVLFVSLFLFTYYSWIDPDYNADRIAQIVERSELFTEDTKAFHEWKNSDPTLHDITAEEYVDRQKNQAESLNKPTIILGGSLLILTVLALFYSMLVSLLFRKILLK